MIHCKERLSIEDLTRGFKNGCKNDQLLGLEYERLPINTYTKTAVSYYGEFGICDILKEFARIDNWSYILDDNNIIGLKQIHDTITLEPGSQVELSIQPQSTVEELKSKVDEINSSLLPVFEKYDVELLNYGVYPKTTYKNIKLIPKQRYKLMANYLWGILSDVMMRETAGIQIGIDFKNEEDAILKFNLANKLSPFITAMFANSSIRGGVDTGYKSFRALAWLNTDSERCGFATNFYDDMTFESYVKTLLKVPMIYIVRGDNYVHINGKINFETFIKDGYEGYDASVEDFNLHANLFFPEIRLRNFIEIRNHDCVDEKYMYSLVALYKSIFYNADAINSIEHLLSNFSGKDILSLRYNVPRFALNTRIKNSSLYEVTQDILRIAEDSMQSAKDSDLKYLTPILELNKQKLTPGDLFSI